MYIESERLIIRNFNLVDVDLIFEINNHPECIKFNGWESMTLEECKVVLYKWIEGYNQHPNYGVYCVETSDGDSIGMAFIMKYQESNDYEVGFRLRRDSWGKGYATEISKLFIAYSKENLDIKNLCAEVDLENERSLKVFRNLNFKEYAHPSGEGGRLFKYDLSRS